MIDLDLSKHTAYYTNKYEITKIQENYDKTVNSITKTIKDFEDKNNIKFKIPDKPKPKSQPERKVVYVTLDESYDVYEQIQSGIKLYKECGLNLSCLVKTNCKVDISNIQLNDESDFDLRKAVAEDNTDNTFSYSYMGQME